MAEKEPSAEKVAETVSAPTCSIVCVVVCGRPLPSCVSVTMVVVELNGRLKKKKLALSRCPQ